MLGIWFKEKRQEKRKKAFEPTDMPLDAAGEEKGWQGQESEKRPNLTINGWEYFARSRVFPTLLNLRL